MNSAEVLIKFKGEADEVEETQKDIESNFKSLQKQGEIAFLGLTAAADAFVGSIVKGGIKYNAQIETYLTRLTTLTGSSKKANGILNQIKKDALATPFEVSSLTQAESLLLSTGLSADQSRKDILALGNAVSASGGGNEELQRMAVNLQQIKNVGKASSLDIKQFAYAGIDIYGLLADSLGVSREEASKMTITYDMLSTALQKASQKGGKYYGAMEKQSKTYAGSMSNLKEAIEVFKGEMAKELFNAFKKIIPQLSSFFNWLTKNKKIITTIAVPLLTFINIIAGLLILKKIAGMFKALWVVLSANPIILIVAGIAALITGLVMLYNNCEGFRNFVNGWFEGFKIMLSGIVGFIKKQINMIKTIFDAVVKFITSQITLTVDIIKATIDTAINIFKTIFITIPTWIYNTVIKPIANFFGNMWNNFKNGAVNAWNGIKSVFGTVANFFKNVFTNAWSAVKAVFSTGGKIFTGIKDGIVKAFKTIVNGIIGGINRVVKVPFDGINGVLKKIKNISIAGKKPFAGLVHTVSVPQIPKLAVGTNKVPEDMLAMIHEGEAVVPKKFNPYANGMNNSMLGIMNNNKGNQVINVYASFKQDNLGQMVRDIKTFSGGARNDFNYGSGA